MSSSSSSKVAVLDPASFKKLAVTAAADDISAFVRSHGLEYTQGCVFYQLSSGKPENVSSTKLLLVENVTTGAVIVGDAVRSALNLEAFTNAAGKVVLDAANHAGFNIYVRCHSHNRKLVPGTSAIYLPKLPAEMIEIDGVDGPTADGNDAPVNPLSFMGPPAKHVQIAISFDTTGSMFSYLDEVSRFAVQTIEKLLNVGSEHVEICVIAHGDYCDENIYYLMKSSGFSSDSGTLATFIDTCGRTGGGDPPEAYEYVLGKTLELPWAEDAQKSLILIGDDVPHDPPAARYDWREEVDKYAEKRIKIYSVQCGHNDYADDFYRHMADATNGIHLRLNDVKEIADFVLAIAYAEGNPRMIIDYHEELKKRGGGALSDSLKKLFEKVGVVAAPAATPAAAAAVAGKRRLHSDGAVSPATPDKKLRSATASKAGTPSASPTPSATSVRVPRPLMRMASTLESSYEKIQLFGAEVVQVDRDLSVGLFCPIYRINLGSRFRSRSLYVTYKDGMFLDDRIAPGLLLYDETLGCLYEGDDVAKKVEFERRKGYNVTHLVPKVDFSVATHLQLLVPISDPQFMLRKGTLVLIR